MELKVPEQIIKKASPKDIKDMVKWSLLKKSGQDYYINYSDKESSVEARFYLPRPMSDIVVAYQSSNRKFVFSSLVDNGEKLSKSYYLPLGELKEFVEIIMNSDDFNNLWDYEFDSPIVKVRRRTNTKNLLSALTGSNQELVEVDITPFLKELDDRLDIVERALGEIILME